MYARNAVNNRRVDKLAGIGYLAIVAVVSVSIAASAGLVGYFKPLTIAGSIG